MVKLFFLGVLLHYIVTVYTGGTGYDLLPDLCGISSGDKIFGGSVTTLNEFPWMALLDAGESGFICGGSLINNRYILTAAHCFGRNNIISVRLGEHNLSDPIDCDATIPGIKAACAPMPLNIPVEKIILHESYHKKRRIGRNDVALIRLSKTVAFSDSIKPVCLPIKELNDTYVGSMATVAGWGRTKHVDQSPVKLKLEVPIKPNDMCSLPLVGGQLCAGGVAGKDSCTGDSGGPLMIQNSTWYLIGIVSSSSSGADCATDGVPAVYTRVANYTDWIVSKLEP